MRILKKFEIWILLIVLISCSVNFNWGGNRWKGILRSTPDAKGYYSYLPALFIYNDLHFKFEDKIQMKFNNSKVLNDYRIYLKSGTINKYFCGTALVQLPFFLFAHILSLESNFESDGYTKTYAIFINLAAIFYTVLGLFFIKKLLGLYSIKTNIISFTLIVILFGTQLFYYTLSEPSMSHPYSFGFISWLLYELKYYFTNKKSNRILLISILLGIVILIRPINGLILFIIPFLAGNGGCFKNRIIEIIKSKKKLLLLLPSIVLPLIQLIIYKIQTGSFFQDPYGGEQFNWSHPEIINVLFSYKKGVFIYTPLLFISLLGLFHFHKQNQHEFISLLFFLFILFYVLSCWWCWWYGWSFSCRPITEFLGIFAILIGAFLNTLRKHYFRIIVSCTIILLILVCQIQTYQYRHFYIHGEKMDKEHYWRVFLRVDLLIMKNNPNKDLLD